MEKTVKQGIEEMNVTEAEHIDIYQGEVLVFSGMVMSMMSNEKLAHSVLERNIVFVNHRGLVACIK